MSEGELYKKIQEKIPEIIEYARGCEVRYGSGFLSVEQVETYAKEILDEAKKEIFSINLSIVDYPAEDYEARSTYEDKITRLNIILKKWFGDAEK